VRRRIFQNERLSATPSSRGGATLPCSRPSTVTKLSMPLKYTSSVKFVPNSAIDQPRSADIHVSRASSSVSASWKPWIGSVPKNIFDVYVASPRKLKVPPLPSVQSYVAP